MDPDILQFIIYKAPLNATKNLTVQERGYFVCGDIVKKGKIPSPKNKLNSVPK